MTVRPQPVGPGGGRLAALVGAVALGLGLAACSSSAPLPPAYTAAPETAAPSTAASTGHASTPPATAVTPSGLPTTNVVTVTPPAGLSPDKQAVYDAYAKYWDYVGRAGATPANPPSLGEVAVGGALTHVQSSIASLKQQGKHTVGATRVSVATVSITGSSAVVCSSMVDTSMDVDAAGTVSGVGSVVPTPVRAELTKPGPTWLVSAQVSGKAC